MAWIALQGFGVNEPFLISMAKAGVFWNIGLLVFNLFPCRHWMVVEFWPDYFLTAKPFY